MEAGFRKACGLSDGDQDDRVTGEERLLTDLQPRERIRDVRQGPDDALYLLTDNDKGRILKLAPRK